MHNGVIILTFTLNSFVKLLSWAYFTWCTFKVMREDVLNSPAVVFLRGKTCFCHREKPGGFCLWCFESFSNSGVPLLFFHSVAFTLLVLTSVSAANYIRPCCIHQPLGSSFSGTVNTLSCCHTCTWPRSAFSPQFRRPHRAELTAARSRTKCHFKPEIQSVMLVIKSFP